LSKGGGKRGSGATAADRTGGAYAPQHRLPRDVTNRLTPRNSGGNTPL